MHDHEGSTGRALGYIARVQLGTAVIHVAHALVRASSPTEEILVGVGHRVATLGFRLADCPDPLIEPMTDLARRVAGLPPLPPGPDAYLREIDAEYRS